MVRGQIIVAIVRVLRLRSTLRLEAVKQEWLFFSYFRLPAIPWINNNSTVNSCWRCRLLRLLSSNNNNSRRPPLAMPILITWQLQLSINSSYRPRIPTWWPSCWHHSSGSWGPPKQGGRRHAYICETLFKCLSTHCVCKYHARVWEWDVKKLPRLQFCLVVAFSPPFVPTDLDISCPCLLLFLLLLSIIQVKLHSLVPYFAFLPGHFQWHQISGYSWAYGTNWVFFLLAVIVPSMEQSWFNL